MDSATLLLFGGGASGGSGGGGRPPRAGLVRAAGRKFRDDAGTFFPLGVSFFPLTWLWKNDRHRVERNLQAIADAGADYVRMILELGGTSWEDRTCDPADATGEMFDAIFGTYGLRVEVCAFGGPSVNPDRVTDLMRAVLEPRQHVILNIEGANEAFQNFTDHDQLRRQVQKIRSWFGGLVTTSSQEAWLPTGPLDMDISTMFTLHPDRGRGDGGWRHPRQGWDAKDFRVPGSNNESIGFQSSVNTESDPLRLVMSRAVGVMCGMAGFVFHPGNVRFGGAADLVPGKPWMPRKANVYDYPEFAPVMRAFRTVDALVPQDAPNWRKTRHGTDHTDHPLRCDDIWPDGLVNYGVTRIHAAYSDRQFVTMPIGVKHYADLRARDACRIVVSDPLTGATVDERTLHAGEIYRLAGADDADASAAFIINGER